MAVWFHMLLKPALRFQHLDESQLAEVQRLLDSNWRVSQRAHLSDVQQGWQVAECGSKDVRCARDLQSCRLKNGRAWVKFLDAESATVRPSRQEAEVAEFFLRAVRLRSPVHLAASFGGRGPAAADAFASGSVAGVGRWFLPEGAPLAVSSIIWFSIPLDAHSLPGWFAGDNTDLETTICALEAFAQLVLLVMQVREAACSRRRPNVGCIALRQQSDNLGVVCSSAKGLSMKEPLASILQATAVFCMQEHLNLRISHLAGCRNCWADALSRGASHDATFWRQLCPARRRHFGLAEYHAGGQTLSSVSGEAAKIAARQSVARRMPCIPSQVQLGSPASRASCGVVVLAPGMGSWLRRCFGDFRELGRRVPSFPFNGFRILQPKGVRPCPLHA